MPLTAVKFNPARRLMILETVCFKREVRFNGTCRAEEYEEDSVQFTYFSHHAEFADRLVCLPRTKDKIFLRSQNVAKWPNFPWP